MRSSREPFRRCVGCMESKPKGELVRIAYYHGILSLDLEGTKDGRGAYICNGGECFDKALKKKAFARTLRGDIDLGELESIRREINESR